MRMNMRNLLSFFAVLVLASAALPASAADVILFNGDPAGQGLNDPTPVAPVGGNPGTTLGQQRQIAYLYAAELWGSVLESDVPIYVQASFQPQTCSPTSGVLGSAGATFFIRDFATAVEPATWHHSALADAREGIDWIQELFGITFPDVSSAFNSRIGTDPNCLSGRGWYYGLDHNHGTDLDFLAVVMHEIAHGIGFSNRVNEATGALASGFSDVYANRTLDVTTGLTWNQMTNAQRAASAINDRNVVWNGTEVTYQAQNVLGPRPSLVFIAPGNLKGSIEVQQATFGPPLSSEGTTGRIVVADDGAGVSSDACEPLINNAAGKIVLADRGTCAFAIKAANAQAAGAKGVLIANTSPGLPPMGGVDPSITIPSVGISQADGAAIRANIFPTINVKLQLDSNFKAGTEQGFVRLYAPTVVSLGSSGSHFDISATPNVLMEPFISSDLRPAETLDLTPALLQDIGWTLLIP